MVYISINSLIQIGLGLLVPVNKTVLDNSSLKPLSLPARLMWMNFMGLDLIKKLWV